MAVAKNQEFATLLASDEPAPYEIVNGGARTPVVLACDHSSNRVPGALGHLGLDPENLVQHIAWDIGAGAVTRLLSERLDAAAVLGGYSRLVVDLNRDLRDPTAYPAISDGTLIPANVSLTIEERYERLDEPVQKAFDLSGMIKIATGPAWRSASEAEREALVAAFVRYTVATYASRFKDYGDQTFQTIAHRTPFGASIRRRPWRNRLSGSGLPSRRNQRP